eukprot:2693171-Ditylum_brightwellii.AAC.1
MSMSYSVGIVGATGAVGKEIVGVLENRGFPVSDLRIFGSSRSAGKEVETKFGKSAATSHWSMPKKFPREKMEL